jgi:hypothetical protein
MESMICGSDSRSSEYYLNDEGIEYQGKRSWQTREARARGSNRAASFFVGAKVGVDAGQSRDYIDRQLEASKSDVLPVRKGQLLTHMPREGAAIVQVASVLRHFHFYSVLAR